MRFNNHLGLKHPDPESLLLCSLKRTKQRRSDEFGSHPATVVGDRNDCPLLVPRRLDSNLSFGSDGIAGVQQQVVDDAAKLIAIKSDFRLQTKISYHLDVHAAVQSPQGVIDQRVEIHLC